MTWWPWASKEPRIAFRSGALLTVTFGGTTLNITGFSLEDGGDLLEITHTGTVARQAFIAGIARGEGNVTANTDSAVLPSATMRFGTKGTLTCDIGGATPWSFSIIIAKVHYASTVNGISNYNFDWKSDATTAGGTMTAPT